MSPIAHARACDATVPVIEQAEAVWDSIVQFTPVSAGSGSLTVTAVAVPGPALDTVMVKPTNVPAVTGVASAVLVMARPGPSTTMVAWSSTDCPLELVALAVLGSEPAFVVGLVRWMLYVAPGAMSPSEHDSTCEPAAPASEHPVPLWDWMVQVTPESEGRVSVTVTSVAVPGPELPTSMVKPTEVPALTGVASAVLVMARLGPLTTMVAELWTVGALVLEALAVLGSEP